MNRRRKHNTFQRIGRFDLPISKNHTRLLDGKNLGVLGAYDDLESGTCIFRAQNGAELIRLSKTCDLRRAWVFTARNAKDLPDPDWEHAKREALFTIATARSRGDKPFLRKVMSRVRTSGVKRGRKPDMKARRRVVEELKRGLSGKPSELLRQLAQDKEAARRSFALTESGQLASTSDRRALKSTEKGQRAIADAVRFHKSIKSERLKVESMNRSLSARVSELCWDAYMTWLFWGEPPLDQSLPKAAAEEFKRLGFHLPRELDPLRQAIERGKQQLPS